MLCSTRSQIIWYPSWWISWLRAVKSLSAQKQMSTNCSSLLALFPVKASVTAPAHGLFLKKIYTISNIYSYNNLGRFYNLNDPEPNYQEYVIGDETVRSESVYIKGATNIVTKCGSDSAHGNLVSIKDCPKVSDLVSEIISGNNLNLKKSSKSYSQLSKELNEGEILIINDPSSSVYLDNDVKTVDSNKILSKIKGWFFKIKVNEVEQENNVVISQDTIQNKETKKSFWKPWAWFS